MERFAGGGCPPRTRLLGRRRLDRLLGGRLDLLFGRRFRLLDGRRIDLIGEGFDRLRASVSLGDRSVAGSDSVGQLRAELLGLGVVAKIGKYGADARDGGLDPLQASHVTSVA